MVNFIYRKLSHDIAFISLYRKSLCVKTKVESKPLYNEYNGWTDTCIYQKAQPSLSLLPCAGHQDKQKCLID